MADNQREIIANIERLNQLMDRNNCSAVVARSGKNFTYLAGFAYPGTLARHLDFPDSPRGVLVVWPRHGDPVLIANEIAAPLARRDGWIENVQVYDGYGESPYARTADVIKEMGLERKRIGLEKDYLSARQWEEMTSLLPKAKIMDCTDMMDQVRWIKTPPEVEMLGATPYTRMDEGLDGADVVMMLRLQNERMDGAFIPSPREYHALYGLTPERLALAKPDALVMHPGPMNRGVEIDSEVADMIDRSIITRQVEMGVAIRMAALDVLTRRSRCVDGWGAAA